MNRRDLFKISAGAVAVAARAQEHRFFTRDEYAALEDVTEMIIPADEKSGGAKAARVADYIDARVAEAFDATERDLWRAGMRQFVGIPSEDRMALLGKLCDGNDAFFVTLKNATIRGYYTSKIGIHDDQDYKGNVYQQGDYAGELP